MAEPSAFVSHADRHVFLKSDRQHSQNDGNCPALDHLARARRDMAQVFEQYDIILTPAALGPAPATLASTGDPRMNAPWTGLGCPAISVPLPVPPGDLPLGLQLTAAPGRDGLLLHFAGVDAIV